MITVEEVRSFATTLLRTTEALVHDRVKFRVGPIVYIAFSRDETVMGFAFPKEERGAMVRAEPHKFLMPGTSDLRYRWLEVRTDAIDETEMRELVLEAWRMVVPKRVAAVSTTARSDRAALWPATRPSRGSPRAGSGIESPGRIAVDDASERVAGRARGMERVADAAWPDEDFTVFDQATVQILWQWRLHFSSLAGAFWRG